MKSFKQFKTLARYSTGLVDRDVLYTIAIVAATVGVLLSFHQPTIWFVIYGGGIVGGLVTWFLLITDRRRPFDKWVRIGLWVAGFAAIGWGLIGLTLVLAVRSLSFHLKQSLEYMEPFSGGAAMGILLLLIFSGVLRTTNRSDRAQ